MSFRPLSFDRDSYENFDRDPRIEELKQMETRIRTLMAANPIPPDESEIEIQETSVSVHKRVQMLLEVLLESDPPVMEFFDEDGSVISVNAFQSKCNLLAREYFKRAKDVGIHHTDRTWEVVELARIRMSYLSHERYLREVLILSPDELYDKAREHEYLLNKTEAAKEQRKILGLKSEYTIRRLALGYLLLAYKLGFSVPKDDFIAHAYYFAKHKEDGVPEEIRKFIESVLADKEWMESDPEKDDDSNEDGNIHSSSYPDL